LEEPFLERTINLGEQAHIAGATDAKGSPRGQSSVPLDERNDVENLVLLCLECHKIVDDKITQGDYTEQMLQDMKRSHEDRIRHLTGMSHDRETAVLRVFGSVRGSVPEMARDQAIRTVIDGAGRYARFPLAPQHHSIEIDLAHLGDPEEGGEAYWLLGRQIIDRKAQQIADQVHEKLVRHISVFALARIPLLIYLGYKLDDKIPVDLYQKHRGKDEGWLWPDDEPEARFEFSKVREGGDGVAVVLSLSGSIPLGDLPKEIGGAAVYEIRPVGADPNPNLFRNRGTLDAFVRAYQDLLSRLERDHPGLSQVHLFPAIPITAAIAAGRGIMRHAQPTFRVYDRVGSEFKPVLEVNER
jgi:hypothetical protein